MVFSHRIHFGIGSLNYFTAKNIGFWPTLIPSIKNGMFNNKLDRFKHLFTLDGSTETRSARISYDYIVFRLKNSLVNQIALNFTFLLSLPLVPIIPLMLIWVLFQTSEIVCYWAAGRAEIEIRNGSFNSKFWHQFKYIFNVTQFALTLVAFIMFTYLIHDSFAFPIGPSYLMVVILSSSLNFFSPRFNFINLVWQLSIFVAFYAFFEWQMGHPLTFSNDVFMIVPVLLALFAGHVGVWSYNEYYTSSLDKEVENFIVQEKLMENTRVLAREKHLIDRIQSTIGEAIAVVDYRQMILQANPAFLNMFNIEDFKSGTINLEDFIEPSLLQSDLVKRNFQPNKDTHYIIQGSPLFVEGEAGLTLFLILDVTEKVRSDQSITQSLKLNALGALSGGIAHDFNNVIAVIRANADLIDGCDNIEEIKSQYLQDILTSCENATGLTRQILSFVRNVPLKSEHVSPSVIVEETIQMVQNSLEPTHKAILHTDTNSIVLCDKNLLKNALINLILNARDATPSGSEIAVHVFNEDDKVVFSVIDHGEGIREENLERVTEPFFTMKANEKGTGIGLSIVKRFAEKSNGEFRIYSQYGMGTQAQIFLPALDGTADDRRVSKPNQGATANKNYKILVVDDNVMLAKTLRKQLEIIGHVAHIAHSLGEYIEQTQAHNFDLVLCDMVLKSETGLDIWEYSQENDIESKFIYISGNISPELRDGLAKQGEYRLLEKPVPFADLQREIQDMMAKTINSKL